MQIKPLDRGLNIAVRTIANRLFPCGFDVTSEIISTIPDMVSRWQSGRPVVWNGASDQTIFADAEINFAFRAWHDHCHLRPIFRERESASPPKYIPWNPSHAYQFDSQGEFLTLNEQKRDLVTLYGRTDRVRQWCQILDAEIIGQFQYNEIHGNFPTNQRAFVEDFMLNPTVTLPLVY